MHVVRYDAANAYFRKCRVAPYCRLRCQKTDWLRRHHAVCHNLARLSGDNADEEDIEKEIEPVVPQPAPLRRPRSPAPQPVRRENDAQERPRKNLNQSGQNKMGNNRNNQNFKNQNMRRPNRKSDSKNADEEEESFEPKAPPQPSQPPKPQQQPKPEPQKQSQPQPQTEKRFNRIQPPFTSAPVPETEKPKETVPEVKSTPKQLASVSDTTPIRKMVPKNYLIETLPLGTTVLLSADASAAECASRTAGYVCLSLHESAEGQYSALCGEYSAACAGDDNKIKPNPGEIFSYLNPEDDAWYRARCLTATTAALIDSSKIVTLTPDSQCRKMADEYQAVPEFCCLLQAEGVKIGDSLKCTLDSKHGDGYKVSIQNAETGVDIGAGEISRWKPIVESAQPKPATAAASIPSVPRPSVSNNSTVILVEATSLDQVFIRPADKESMRKFDGVLHDVLLYGMKATPLKAPPQPGDVVVGKFTDGNCYRALCKRTSVKLNKYLLEYIEYGNTEINTLETIYPCPPELNLESKPTVVSLVKLPVKAKGLTAAATDYIETLRDSSEELTVTIPDGSKSCPSGSEVLLSVAKNKESVNDKLQQLCTPEWKKMEEKGADVVEAETVMFHELEYIDLPASGCELEVLDVNVISSGAVSACVKNEKQSHYVLTTLTEKMEEYCNSELGRQPYLPKLEELCIAKCPPYPQWFRAVLCEQVSGPGGSEARVCYIDYGNVELVPVSSLRKMLREFVKGVPALSSHIDIRGFPENPTNEQLAKAVQHMNLDDEGHGTLKVTKCQKNDPGVYLVDAPELLKAMGV